MLHTHSVVKVPLELVGIMRIDLLILPTINNITVSIEWPPIPADCYVNQSCSFSAKIGRVSHSLKGPLNVTANVAQTSQKSQISTLNNF